MKFAHWPKSETEQIRSLKNFAVPLNSGADHIRQSNEQFSSLNNFVVRTNSQTVQSRSLTKSDFRLILGWVNCQNHSPNTLSLVHTLVRSTRLLIRKWSWSVHDVSKLEQKSRWKTNACELVISDKIWSALLRSCVAFSDIGSVEMAVGCIRSFGYG